MSLIAYLSNSHPERFQAATQHAFLARAGAGTLAAKPLCRWLVQDKYYQFAYVNFIGRLISKLDLTSYAFPDAGGGGENLQWRTLQALMGALAAIKTEIEFYDKTVEKYGLNLVREGPSDVTSRYVRLFEDSSAAGKPLVWGLTVLWATEYCYLKAWSYAKAQRREQVGRSEIDALHKEFIPNWTSKEFEAAVAELGNVTDLWADSLEKDEKEACEQLWSQTLILESEFWPNV